MTVRTARLSAWPRCEKQSPAQWQPARPMRCSRWFGRAATGATGSEQLGLTVTIGDRDRERSRLLSHSLGSGE